MGVHSICILSNVASVSARHVYFGVRPRACSRCRGICDVPLASGRTFNGRNFVCLCVTCLGHCPLTTEVDSYDHSQEGGNSWFLGCTSRTVRDCCAWSFVEVFHVNHPIARTEAVRPERQASTNMLCRAAFEATAWPDLAHTQTGIRRLLFSSAA